MSCMVPSCVCVRLLWTVDYHVRALLREQGNRHVAPHLCPVDSSLTQKKENDTLKLHHLETYQLVKKKTKKQFVHQVVIWSLGNTFCEACLCNALAHIINTHHAL